MLAEARQKRVYQALDCMDMNQPLAIAADAYDAVTCIGTFTSTHVAPEALFELVRVTRPGGAVVFTVRDDYWVADRVRQLGGGAAHVGSGWSSSKYASSPTFIRRALNADLSY